MKVFEESNAKEISEYIVTSYREQVEKINKLFNRLDVDNSGSLETEEMIKIFSDLECDIGDEELEKCIKDIDTDGSGTISPEEFIAWYLTG
jgi:Ca2+-binding EF-hand superfamily protein